MLRKLFAVRDQKSQTFTQPFSQLTTAEAERTFTTHVNEKGSPYNTYPEDFDLYYLGDYDDVEGKIQPLDTPQHVAKAVNVLKA